MKIYTTIKTLKDVKRVFNDIGLQELIDSSKNKSVSIDVISIVDKLLDDNKLVELLQIITRDKKTKFEDMELVKVKEILSNFFGNIIGLFPDAVKNSLQIKVPKNPVKMSS